MNEIAGHLDEGVLQALADGELEVGDTRHAESHLAGCLVCRREMDGLQEASRTLSGALRMMDRAPAANAAPAAAPRRPAQPRPVPARGGWSALPRAAVIVLGLGLAAAASATVPGSPVRAWMESLLGGGADTGAPAAVAPSTSEAPAQSAEQAPAEAGVSITAAGGAVRVVVSDAAPGLEVRAILTDGDRAGVFGSGAASDARFTTGPGRIDVSGASGGILRVEIPRGAGSATVVINGEVRVTKEGAVLRAAPAAGSASGTEVSYTVR